MSRIQLVLGVAIWRILAHWRLITFSRKMVFYIVTQVIDCDVTIVAQRKQQDMRVPHARAHLETQWCVKVRVHRYCELFY